MAGDEGLGWGRETGMATVSQSGSVSLSNWPLAGLGSATQGGEKLLRVEGGSDDGGAAQPTVKRCRECGVIE